MKNSRILITGAGGFIGFYIAKFLSNDPSNTLYLVDNFIRSEPDDLYFDLIAKPNVNDLRFDLCDLSSYSSLPENVDYIFHMAAFNGTQNFYEFPDKVLLNSTLPTIYLINKYSSCRKKPVFIYAGSSESYAGAVTKFEWEVPTSENVPLVINDPMNPRWSYGGSKLFGEITTTNLCTPHNIPFLIIRYHNVYGPRMGDRHVIPDFLDRASRGVFSLYGHEDTRSFIYISDAVEATVLASQCSSLLNSVVNLGGEIEITMNSLAQTIMDVCGFHGEIELYPSPPGSVSRRSPDISKLKSNLNWEPAVSLADGLRFTADYYLG